MSKTPRRTTMLALSNEIQHLRQDLATSENLQREIRDLRFAQKQLAQDNIEHLAECAEKSAAVDEKLTCLVRESHALKQDMWWIKAVGGGLLLVVAPIITAVILRLVGSV